MRKAEKFIIGKYFPLTLLLIMGITWFIQVPRYGFYLDDWIYLTAYDQGGIQGLINYSLVDSRPGLLPWVIGLGFKIVGNNRLGWQIYSLFWRYLGGVFNWLLIRKLWPSRKDIAAYSAILFMIFPFFKHQAFSIAYNQNWVQYAFLILSFLLTIIAIRTDSKRKKIIFFLLSYLLSAAQLMMTEYLLSLEAIRVVLIWFALRDRQYSKRKRFSQTIKIVLPYWGILFAYIVWRFAIMPQMIHDRNEINLFSEHPDFIDLFFYLIQMLIQYMTESVWGIWYRSLDPANIDLSIPSIRVALIIGTFISAILIIAFSKIRKTDGFFDENEEGKEILLVGIFATLLGYLPGIAIDKSPSTQFLYHDRFLIPSFWGISLALTAFIAVYLKGFRKKIILLSLLCGICVFFQIKNSIYYRNAWESQQNFQWQMKWRAPDLKANTAVLGDAIIASFMGGWADGAMVFEMYGKNDGYNPTPYWYLVVGEGDYKTELDQKLPITYANKIYNFKAQFGDFLVLTKPEWDRCLWVLDEADLKNPYIQPVTKNLIQYQNKSRILYDSDYKMPEGVFGSDYRHDWCYYYENAAREVDLMNYDKALELYKEAVAANMDMKNPVELTPFIRSAAMTGQWDFAAELTKKGSAQPHITWEYYKNLWDLLFRETPDSADRANAFKSIQEYIRQ